MCAQQRGAAGRIDGPVPGKLHTDGMPGGAAATTRAARSERMAPCCQGAAEVALQLRDCLSLLGSLWSTYLAGSSASTSSNSISACRKRGGSARGLRAVRDSDTRAPGDCRQREGCAAQGLRAALGSMRAAHRGCGQPWKAISRSCGHCCPIPKGDVQCAVCCHCHWQHGVWHFRSRCCPHTNLTMSIRPGVAKTTSQGVLTHPPAQL